MSSKLYVHKEGRVHRIFKTPFTDWSNPPDENVDFPETVIANDEAHLKAQLGNADYVVIDRPAPPEAKPSPRLPLGALLGAMAAMGLPQEKISQVAAHRTQTEGSGNVPEVSKAPTLSIAEAKPQAELARVGEAASIQDRMLQEFRVVVASNLPSDVQAIGQFILDVCPDLENEVQAIAKGQKRKKFSL